MSFILKIINNKRKAPDKVKIAGALTALGGEKRKVKLYELRRHLEKDGYPLKEIPQKHTLM